MGNEPWTPEWIWAYNLPDQSDEDWAYQSYKRLRRTRGWPTIYDGSSALGMYWHQKLFAYRQSAGQSRNCKSSAYQNQRFLQQAHMKAWEQSTKNRRINPLFLQKSKFNLLGPTSCPTEYYQRFGFGEICHCYSTTIRLSRQWRITFS